MQVALEALFGDLPTSLMAKLSGELDAASMETHVASDNRVEVGDAVRRARTAFIRRIRGSRVPASSED